MLFSVRSSISESLKDIKRNLPAFWPFSNCFLLCVCLHWTLFTNEMFYLYIQVESTCSKKKQFANFILTEITKICWNLCPEIYRNLFSSFLASKYQKNSSTSLIGTAILIYFEYFDTSTIKKCLELIKCILFGD